MPVNEDDKVGIALRKGDKLQLRVHVLSKVKALALEIQGKGVTGLIGHAFLLQHNILEHAGHGAGPKTQRATIMP